MSQLRQIVACLEVCEHDGIHAARGLGKPVINLVGGGLVLSGIVAMGLHASLLQSKGRDRIGVPDDGLVELRKNATAFGHTLLSEVPINTYGQKSANVRKNPAPALPEKASVETPVSGDRSRVVP